MVERQHWAKKSQETAYCLLVWLGIELEIFQVHIGMTLTKLPLRYSPRL